MVVFTVRHAARLALVGFALSFAVLCRAYWLARADETFLPTIWPFVFGLVAVGCAALVVHPRRDVAIVVGSLAFAVCLSRVAGVISNLADGTVYSNADRATAAFGVWPMLAAAVLYGFRRGLAPWASAAELRRRTQHRRRVTGE